MKKIAIVLGIVVATASLSGCAGRPLNSQDRAAILGASMGQALQNAHDAAYGQNGYQTEEQKEQEQYRYNQSRHHHHGKHQTMDNNGVVYQDGVKGYYDAYGNFHAY
ncbi:hypothetical protein [Herbiconiux daphne]|uniref:Lipoprotein n=1 Tax=Herbiconiux daphne TaxID=2970914 RepID=A0ABT2HB29_9MICO|nr:hypothetical protein [Herbiconiux daphne]MCS5737151.1 hypothetical protein [Herbiconiux daphne]